MSRMRLHSEHFDKIISVKWQSVSARHRIPIENTTMMVDRRTSKETDWDQKRNEEGCKQNSELPYQLVHNYFWKDVGLSSDQETKKNGTGLCPSNLAGIGTQHQKK